MPKIEPTEKAAAAMTGVGQPFEFKTEREATDVDADAGHADTLSFSLAVRLTLRHSPEVQSALAKVRQAQAEARQARLLPNPVLSFAFRIPTSGGRPDVEASVTADLLSLLLKPGQISAADQRLRKSVADSLAVVLDVLQDVQSQYAKAQSLAAQAAIGDARRGILQELRRLTEARLQGGEATRLDLLTVQSEVVDLDAELLALRSDERQARLTLARLIGRPSSAAMWKLDQWSPPAAPAGDEAASIKAALERRPELRSVVWELAALGEEMCLTRTTPFLAGGDAGISAEQTEGEWTLGPAATLALPVFDFGQAQRERVAARIVEQRHELTRLERQIVQDVRVAHQQLRSSQAVLAEVENRLLPLQTDRLKQAEAAYRSGSADVLAVRSAEQDLQRARSRQVDLQEQLSQANFRLARAIGGNVAGANTSSTTQPE
ncbi:MAG: TolC family protein [Tepidisphaeraceae bacterium]